AQRTQQRLTIRTEQLEQAQRLAQLGDWRWQQGFQWSQQALRILRQPSGAVENAEQLFERIHPADRPALREAFQGLRRGRELAINVRLQAVEQGRPIWLRFLGETDGNDSASGSVQDVSLRQLDEDHLRENERRLRQLFEQARHIAVQGYD